MAADVWRTFRDDLQRRAFAFEPIAPLAADTGWLRELPDDVRRVAIQLPRIGPLALALAVLVWETQLGYSYGDFSSFRAMLIALPLVIVVLRPVTAYWLSLLGMTVAPALLQGGADGMPFNAPGVLQHLVVLGVVAWRCRPVTSLALWGLSALGCAVPTLWFATQGPHGVPKPMVMTAVCGAVLLILCGVRGWRDSRREVVEQVAVAEEERSKRTVLEERTVIARELHDVVAHHMSVVAIQAEAAPYRVQDPPEELVKALGVIRENAVAALTELRRVLGVVRSELPAVPEAPQPTLADVAGLLANVRESGCEARLVTTGGTRPLPPGVELSAYRIVQEALSNALRYAPDAAVQVELSYVLGGLGLRVANERPTTSATAHEAGASSPSAHGGGQGILGMRERVALLGGELSVGESADGGWAVEAFLPVAPAEPSAEDESDPARPSDLAAGA